MKHSLRPMLVVALVLSFCGFAFAWNGGDHDKDKKPQDSQSTVIQSQGLSNFSPSSSSSSAGVNNSGNNTGNASVTGPTSTCGASGFSSCSSNSGTQNTANGGAGGTGGNASSNSGVYDSGNSSSETKDSGNSANFNNNEAKGGSVKDSGNSANENTNLSSNKNSNKQGQSQGQDQGQSQSSDNSNSGNNTTVDSHNVIQAPKIPVSSAFAPNAFPTANCAMAYSGAGQGMLAGAAGAFTRIDKTCQQLEVARSFALYDARAAYCKVMTATKWAKKAGVTMDDCMTKEAVPAPTPAAAIEPVKPVAPVAAIVNPLPLR